MKILIVGTIYTDCDDREEALCQRLSIELKNRGHEIDLCYLPFNRNVNKKAEQIFAHNLVCTDRAEAIITVGYPSCFIPHRNDKKVCYLFDYIPEVHSISRYKIQNTVFIASEELLHEMSLYGSDFKSFFILPPDDARLTDRIEGALI